MLLNNIEVKILSTAKLIDVYNNNFPEDFLMKNVIYCIHNEVNGKNYIGQTIKVKDRFSRTYVGHFKDYDRFINGEINETRALYRAWKKYGLESFTVFVIDVGSNREELNKKEIYWIKTLHTCVKDSECFGYNLTWGADDMSVTCRESIQRSLETRKNMYGDYFPKCHTQEAYKKGDETKKDRYGYTGFINAFTPEANSKRKQTNLERYGTLHGPNMSKEAINKMVEKKIDKYGDPMGVCNTPENREKAKKNSRITRIFNSISRNLNLLKEKGIDIQSWEQYSSYMIHRYHSVNRTNLHLEKIMENITDLRSDRRWSTTYEKIFVESINK